MVPARNLLRDAHGRGASTGIDDAVAALPTLPAAPVSAMAQEPFNEQQEPTKQPPPQQERQEVQEEQREAGLRLQQEVGTSGNGSGGHKDWLRLGLGPSSHSGGGDGGAELELFTEHAPPPQPLQMPGAPFLRPAVAGIPPAPMPLLPVPRAGPPWLPPWHTAAAAPPPPPMLQLAPRGIFAQGAGTAGFEMIRVVLPPAAAAAAAAAGIWFALQAAQNQGREPFLPQIPRSYLRIKDGRVTIRLLIKYLVNKLGLEDESEVEITCRGRPLLPFLTLQHVRDSIWCQRDAMSPSVPPDMSTANHIMVLQYRRRL